MLTKTELIEKLNQLKKQDDEFNYELSCLQDKDYVLNIIIELAEQLPDTTELQAENEVLKLALKNTLKKLHLAKYPNSTHWLPKTDIEYAIMQAQKEIDDGK